ncbi:hypothetical protein LVJ94_17450 [Pendulispora rubella]|uniref:Insecticide toxin TcdB middle/N-terminal domain-containing protein n=1 Tax=Pendulispora rubella TaxID=2741070 RepID=A0ABZ2LDZ5_9BACT
MKRKLFVRSRNSAKHVERPSTWRRTARARSWLLALSVLFILPVVAKADGGGASHSSTKGVFGPSAQGWADTRTGGAQASYPFQLLRARGAIQPDLTLNYSSGASVREAGVGWGFDHLPTIELTSAQGGRPWQRFDDARNQRVTFNGAPLLYIASGQSLTIKRLDGSDERLPDWAAGWRYYRQQEDSSQLRFFWSPNQRTWKVESPTGEVFELGEPLTAGMGASEAIEYDTEPPFKSTDRDHPIRWRVVLRYDAHGGAQPNNVVRYDWSVLNYGAKFLVPIAVHDTLDRDGDFTHHTILTYEGNDAAPRDLAHLSQAPTWGARPVRRLKTVEVQNKTQVVRRYHLAYETIMHRSYLHSITEEGACAEENCPTLAPTTFRYTPPLDKFEFRRIATPPGVEMPFGRLNNIAFVDADKDGISDIVMDSTVLYRTHVKDPPLGRVQVRLEKHTVNNDGMGEYADDSLFNRDTGLALVYPRDAIDGEAMVFIKSKDDPYNSLYGTVIRDKASPHAFGWEMSLDGQAAFSPWEGALIAIGDIDGNGTPDILHKDTSGGPNVQLYSRFRWGEGLFPGLKGMSLITSFNRPFFPYRENVPFYALADMNGDNYADLVTLADSPYSSDQPLIYFPGNGAGDFACRNSNEICSPPPASLCEGSGSIWCKTPRVALGPSAPRHPQQDPEGSVQFVLSDVNQDGLTDIIRPDYGSPPNYNTTLHIWINDDGVNFHREPDVVDPLYAGMHLATTDIDGDGVSDIVLVGPDQIGYFKRTSSSTHNPFEAQYPGLLESIDNGVGGSTQFLYRAVAQLDQDASEEGHLWGRSRHSPQPSQVVTFVLTKQAGSADGENDSSVSYTYRDPYYDPLEARLLGFQQVDEEHVDRGKLNTDRINTYHITTKYAFPCTLGFCPKGSEVSDYRSVMAVPYEVDIAAGGGSNAVRSSTLYRSHVVSTYPECLSAGEGPILKCPAEGGDPVRGGARNVSFAYTDKVDTYLYDTAPFTAEPSTLGFVPLTRGSGGPEIAITLPSSHREHLREEQDRDILGNVVQTRDYGRVGDNGQADAVVTTSYDYTAVGAPQRYMYRVRHQTVSGFGARPGLPTDPDRRLEYQYNDPANPGDVTDVVATLTGTLPLVRAHEKVGAKIAPAPAGASVDGAIHISHVEYDAYGNIVRSHGPNETSCVSTVYDPEANFLPILTRRHVKGCALEGTLAASRHYDERFDLPKFISDADGSIQLFTYDAFGRIDSSTDNDPESVGLPSSESARFQYFDNAAKATQATKMTIPTGPGQSRTVWQYSDAFANPKATIAQADSDDGQGAPWIVDGAVKQFLGAAPFAHYRPFGSTADPAQLEFAFPPSADTVVAYSLGRPILQTDRGRRVQVAYHALSIDVSDEEDIVEGVHANTPRTAVYDGHGKLIRSTVRNKTATGVDEINTDFDYNAAGQVLRITKRHSQGGETFVRWMQYDSLGRLVLNAEPNTTKNFVADAQSPAALATMRAWRYAYDDAGRAVATSDARGCGKNIVYDSLGRLLAEDYSPCLAHHERYTPLKLAEGTGAEVLYQYNALGQLTAVADRGAVTQFAYDARGRVRETARRLTRPASDGLPSDGELDFGGLDIEFGVDIHIGGGGDAGAGSEDDRYAEHWFRKAFRYDLADRLVSEDTGADIPEFLVNGKSTVDYAYTARGFRKSISSSYGALVAAMTYNADGTPDVVKLADAAATVQKMTYGPHDVTRYLVSREAPELWKKSTANYTPADANVPSSLQKVLADLSFTYDGVGNPTEVKDARDPNEWPAGARPKSQKLTYDDLYRLTEERAEYNAPNKVDPQVSPFDAEESAPFSRGILPRLVRAKRSTSVQAAYDFQGNTTSINDNDSTVLDRAALGAVVNGDAEGHPNRLTGSSLGVQVTYDPTGNVVEMLAPRTGECSTDACSHHFIYNWDEVGQLVRARRWDYEEIPSDEVRYPELPFGTPEVDLRYSYSQGERVLKSVKPRGRIEKHSAEIFDSLRLDNTKWFIDDYEVDAASESIYAGGAHVVVTEDDLPTTEEAAMSSARRHVFLSLGDKLGSTSIVIDRDTAELAEAVQYHPFGTVDSDYRPERWGSHREPYQFTGKEADAEVGLTYFGARYYAASLGRWMSADPLTVHGGGDYDLNPYAYVNGAVLNLTDPTGLCPDRGPCPTDPPPITSPPGPGPDAGGGPPGGGGSGPIKNGHPDVRPISGPAQGTGSARWFLRHLDSWQRGSKDGMVDLLKENVQMAMRFSVTRFIIGKDGVERASLRLDQVVHKYATPEAQRNLTYVASFALVGIVAVLTGPGEGKVASAVWDLGLAERGLQIETALGGNLPRGYPFIDKFIKGVATSIKSVDLRAATYQNAKALTSTLNRYINKVAAFSGKSFAGQVITNSQVKARALEVAIPAGIAPTPAQQAALQAAVEYGKTVGVQVTIIPF